MGLTNYANCLDIILDQIYIEDEVTRWNYILPHVRKIKNIKFV